jgi:2-polyprenyl-6-methoxyphenol hydroxylase-like FAD-dependent oxidoreductase
MGSLPSPPPETLRVAIVGAGPAGLGAAIALSKLPNLQVNIYEKATELREVGAGIRIGYNGWKVLGLLGAADGVRGHHKVDVKHRSVASVKPSELLGIHSNIAPAMVSLESWSDQPKRHHCHHDNNLTVFEERGFNPHWWRLCLRESYT